MFHHAFVDHQIPRHENAIHRRVGQLTDEVGVRIAEERRFPAEAHAEPPYGNHEVDAARKDDKIWGALMCFV